ncbi:MAG: ABC transporter ATP-binding protein [Planctomycetes bacterium]|nr:ABC transporter ATP-binding protein [Planctomycetota bacterium]
MEQPIPKEVLPRDPARFAGRPAVISCKGLKKVFDGRTVLKDINLEIVDGETIVIMGGSGCGKSTFLRLLLGAYAPDGGTIHILGKDIGNADDATKDEVRKRTGILFQSGALFNSMTVGENVALPMREHTPLTEDVIEIMVKMKLELVGLRDAEHLKPSQLSGGMRKRVGLARAIALDPKILYYDEPTTGLDPITSGVINTMIMDLSKKLRVTSVVVTHDMGSAFTVADRMAMLYLGEVIQIGTPQEFLNSPDPRVQQFVYGKPDGPIPLRMSRTDYVEDLLAEDPLAKAR